MIFKEISRQDIITSSTVGNQIVDVLEADLYDDTKRKRYQNWYNATKVAAGDPNGAEFEGEFRTVVSGLFQTIHDIEHTQQSSNPLVDVTVGLNPEWELLSNTIAESPYGILQEVDAAGKPVYSPGTLMVREKTDIYRQMASQLLGDRDAVFSSRLGEQDGYEIDNALFLSFRRLFFRDGKKRGTFLMRMYKELEREVDTGTFALDPNFTYFDSGYSIPSDVSSEEIVLTDATTTGNRKIFFGGDVGQLTIVQPGTTPLTDDDYVGLVFYDAGIVVLDMKKIIDYTQNLGGLISTLLDNELTYDGSPISTPTWSNVDITDWNDATSPDFLPINKRPFDRTVPTFIEGSPDLSSYSDFEMFLVCATIDEIVDHICRTRFISDPDSNLVGITFQNKTKIKSMLVFCRVAPGEFNYSNNRTYVDKENRIIARDDDGVEPFSYITTVGLYDAQNNLLAVAKTSRPIENGPDRDITLRVRLDF